MEQSIVLQKFRNESNGKYGKQFVKDRYIFQILPPEPRLHDRTVSKDFFVGGGEKARCRYVSNGGMQEFEATTKRVVAYPETPVCNSM